MPDIQWFKGVREIFPVVEGTEKRHRKHGLQQTGNNYTLLIHDCYGEDGDEYFPLDFSLLIDLCSGNVQVYQFRESI